MGEAMCETGSHIGQCRKCKIREIEQVKASEKKSRSPADSERQSGKKNEE
jgi:hypothetical protein